MLIYAYCIQSMHFSTFRHFSPLFADQCYRLTVPRLLSTLSVAQTVEKTESMNQSSDSVTGVQSTVKSNVIVFTAVCKQDVHFLPRKILLKLHPSSKNPPPDFFLRRLLKNSAVKYSLKNVTRKGQKHTSLHLYQQFSCKIIIYVTNCLRKEFFSVLLLQFLERMNLSRLVSDENGKCTESAPANFLFLSYFRLKICFGKMVIFYLCFYHPWWSLKSAMLHPTYSLISLGLT